MFCRYCGKELNDKAVVCPGCGILTCEESAPKTKEAQQIPYRPQTAYQQPQAQPQQQTYQQQPVYQAQPRPRKTNVLAIVGFVLSFFVCLAGLICSAIALKQVKTSGEDGRGLALAGVIISAISLGILIVALLFYSYILVILFLAFGSSSSI